MSFVLGFEKTAGFMDSAKNVGSALSAGVKASGGQTIGSALKLEGLSHIGDAVKKSGGLGKALSTEPGRKALAQGVGKAAPSLAVLGAGGYAAKKIYNKATEDDRPQYY